jgi:hypothetical protein
VKQNHVIAESHEKDSNEGVSDSINWHAPSLHKHNSTAKITKESVKI